MHRDKLEPKTTLLAIVSTTALAAVSVFHAADQMLRLNILSGVAERAGAFTFFTLLILTGGSALLSFLLNLGAIAAAARAGISGRNQR